jgi:hypothetical protein
VHHHPLHLLWPSHVLPMWRRLLLLHHRWHPLLHAASARQRHALIREALQEREGTDAQPWRCDRPCMQ